MLVYLKKFIDYSNCFLSAQNSFAMVWWCRFLFVWLFIYLFCFYCYFSIYLCIIYQNIFIFRCLGEFYKLLRPTVTNHDIQMLFLWFGKVPDSLTLFERKDKTTSFPRTHSDSRSTKLKANFEIPSVYAVPHLHDDLIWVQLPGCISVQSLSCRFTHERFITKGK